VSSLPKKKAKMQFDKEVNKNIQMKKILPLKLNIAKRLRNRSNYLLKVNGYIKSLK
jgi:hypothetical protein